MIDDAVLILSELLSNACRYARPLGPLADLGDDAGAEVIETVLAGVPSGSGHGSGAHGGGPHGGGIHGNGGHGQGPHGGTDGGVLVGWRLHADGMLTVEVTDGGGITRPLPASPSVTARGGRGLGIVDRLASDWGVRDAPGEVTVWAALPARARHARRGGSDARSA